MCYDQGSFTTAHLRAKVVTHKRPTAKTWRCENSANTATHDWGVIKSSGCTAVNRTALWSATHFRAGDSPLPADGAVPSPTPPRSIPLLHSLPKTVPLQHGARKRRHAWSGEQVPKPIYIPMANPRGCLPPRLALFSSATRLRRSPLCPRHRNLRHE